ncbi:unnamed protein product, partial [Rotaria sp. Silwood2]
EHLNQSHSNLRCDDDHEQFNPVNKINEYEVSQCQQRVVNCILKNFGCNGPIIRTKMKDHYLTEQHQHAVLNAVHQQSSQLNDRQTDIDSTEVTNAGVCDADTAQPEEVTERLSILVRDTETLTSDEQRLSHELLPTLAEELSKVKLSVEESNPFLEGVQHNQDLLNQDLSSLQEKINDLQCVSHDGTLIWKITNFQEKMSKLNSYFYAKW